MANLPYCDIIVTEFELQLHYYVHFLRITIGMSSFIPASVGWIVPQLFFYKDRFGTKQPIKVDMPLSKETKPKQEKILCQESMGIQ